VLWTLPSPRDRRQELAPRDLHAAFDLILQAFAHYEAGRDEEARAALQGIGLQSPLLEWKVLLRGPLGLPGQRRRTGPWKTGKRLDQARLSSRLCAPMRAGIDPAFLAAQPPAVQQTLRNQDDATARGHRRSSFARAPRDADERQPRPGISQGRSRSLPACSAIIPICLPVSRSASTGRSLITASRGHRTLSARLRRTDRSGAGLSTPGPGARDTRHVVRAHGAWQDFIKEVAEHPAAWPASRRKRVQALIWARMAENTGPQRNAGAAPAIPFSISLAAGLLR